MDWNSITLTVLAIFGLLSLVVTLLVQFVNQLPDLFVAIRKVRAAARRGGRVTPGETQGDEPSDRSAD